VVVQAVFWTVLLHAGLFYGLTLKPRPKPTRLQLYGPTCAMLSPRREARRWEQDIWTWADLEDPTLFALPNERLGFSRVRQERRVLPYTEVPGYRYVTTYPGETIRESGPLADPAPPLDKAVSLSWPDRLPPIPAEPPLGRAPTRVIWRFPDGRVIEDAPALPEEKPDMALAPRKLTGPTRIELIRSENRLRVAVRQSCGNVELDRLAFDALVHRAGEYQRRQNAGGSVKAASWFPEAGKSVEIEIEWRLAATMATPTAPSSPGP